MKILRSAVLAAGILPVASVAALADENNVMQRSGDTYVGASAGIRYFDFEGVRAPLQGPGTPAEGADGNAFGYGGDIFLGFGLGEGMNFGGTPLSFEVRAHYAEADNKNKQNTSGFGLMPIDGRGFSNGNFGAFTLVSEAEYQRFGFDALLRGDISSDEMSRVSAFGGFSYNRLNQEHDFSSVPGSSFSLRDDVAADYFGVAFGADGRFPVDRRLAVIAGGRVDVAYADANLDANQNFGGTPISVSDDDQSVAVTARANLGFEHDFGPFKVGLMGFGEYLSYVPTVEHPYRDQSPADVFSSHIESDHGVIWGANLVVTVPLN